MSELLSVRSLSKRFETPGIGSVSVFSDITFSLDTGEFTALVGPSGSGKSTLLNIIGTLDTPSSGSVFFEGADLFTHSAADLASLRNKKIGFIFQFHHLLPEFSALENVMMPALIAGMNYETASQRASQLLDEIGLSTRKDHRPAELSGGEMQRTAVARAFMMEPALILADEPTGNLDAANSELLFTLFTEMIKKHSTTVLLVTHNDDLAARTSRVLRLENGSIRV
jgi:lipoprotein-releasing system ATP-binding protein